MFHYFSLHIKPFHHVPSIFIIFTTFHNIPKCSNSFYHFGQRFSCFNYIPKQLITFAFLRYIPSFFTTFYSLRRLFPQLPTTWCHIPLHLKTCKLLPVILYLSPPLFITFDCLPYLLQLSKIFNILPTLNHFRKAQNDENMLQNW